MANPIETAFTRGVGAFNISRWSNGRWQVSTRDNRSDGWQIYYGNDLGEVIARAAAGGTQLPVTINRKHRHAAFPWDAPR